MPHLESASAQSRLMNLWAVCSGIAQCCSRPIPPAARWCFEMCTTRRRSRWSSGWRACARGIAVTRQPCLGPLPHPPPRREPDGPRLTGPPAVRACAPAALTRSPPVLGGWGLQTPSRGTIRFRVASVRGSRQMYPWAREDAPRCTEARRLMVTHFERAASGSFPWTREIPHMFYKKPGHIWGISLKNNIVRIVYRLERSIRSKRAGVRWGVLFCGCALSVMR